MQIAASTNTRQEAGRVSGARLRGDKGWCGARGLLGVGGGYTSWGERGNTRGLTLCPLCLPHAWGRSRTPRSIGEGKAGTTGAKTWCTIWQMTHMVAAGGGAAAAAAFLHTGEAVREDLHGYRYLGAASISLFLSTVSPVRFPFLPWPRLEGRLPFRNLQS